MPSSVIKAFCYDDKNKILSVEYLSGKIYDYFQVPKMVYDEFRGTMSKGGFLNRHIKGKFPYRERRTLT